MYLEEKVKAYLIEKFEAGERSGTKADPLSVSREMITKANWYFSLRNGKQLRRSRAPFQGTAPS